MELTDNTTSKQQKNHSNDEKLEQTQEIYDSLLKKILAICAAAKSELQELNKK